MRRWLMSCLLLVVVLWPAVSGAAEERPSSTLAGTVLDPMRAPVAGVLLQIWRGPVAVASLHTDLNGRFAFSLPQATYRIRFSAPGFVDVEREVGVVQPTVTLPDVVLAIAAIHEDVTVTAVAEEPVQTAMKTPTRLLDVPQAITVVGRAMIADQMMVSMGDALRYVPGVAVHQGENNRDQVVMRGNSSSADFFVDGVRDDVQYFRDVYNLDRIEALKGSNAMIFGRGGAGGVVNRVSRVAGFSPSQEVSLQTGSFGYQRATGGVNRALTSALALRVDGMFEDSDSYRHGVGLRRVGVTPTATFLPSSRTQVVVRYEFLQDRRVADRGIPSYQGRPVDVDPSAYFGDPGQSDVFARVHLLSGRVEQRVGAFTIRNHTVLANYGRHYQNFVPGLVSSSGTQVSLSAYNNTTDRRNAFNQTDLITQVRTGRVDHALLSGVEVGRQLTDNLRNTGYFNDTVTSVLAPLSAPRVTVPVVFRQSQTDAANHVTATVAAAYVQDQAALSSTVDLVAGVRLDRFSVQLDNHRSGEQFDRPDTLVSPRLGLVVKPRRTLSLYMSQSVTYLPGSGDQFASLTNITAQLKPERFRNYETGLKWEPRRGTTVTGAAYRLDRTNTRSTDPTDPTRIVQTGSQRTNGVEAGVNGRLWRGWSMAGGYAWQRAAVTSATAAAMAGAEVGQVPHQTVSLWNQVQISPGLAVAAGLMSRTTMFAAIDNTVRLPGFARCDAAVFVRVTRTLRLQVNAENVLNRRYVLNADGNTNISPGSPRSVRVGLTSTF